MEMAMAIDPMKSFEIPADMRKFAEQSVAQARQAFEGFMSAANKAVVDMEARTTMASSGMMDVSSRAVSFAQRNIATSFDFAQKLVQAKNVQEVVKLHQDYIQEQIRALNEQAKELSEVAAQMTRETTKPQ
jgi:phasin